MGHRIAAASAGVHARVRELCGLPGARRGSPLAGEKIPHDAQRCHHPAPLGVGPGVFVPGVWVPRREVVGRCVAPVLSDEETNRAKGEQWEG